MLHLARNGSAYNNLLAEDITNRYTQGNNMSLFCGYNLSELSNAHCKTIVKKVSLSHDYVILDVPSTVYKASRNHDHQIKDRKCKL